MKEKKITNPNKPSLYLKNNAQAWLAPIYSLIIIENFSSTVIFPNPYFCTQYLFLLGQKRRRTM